MHFISFLGNVSLGIKTPIVLQPDVPTSTNFFKKIMGSMFIDPEIRKRHL